MFDSTRSPRTYHVLFLIVVILTLGLAAAPAFATDPEEADPDPDGARASGPLGLVWYELSELVAGVWHRVAALVGGLSLTSSRRHRGA